MNIYDLIPSDRYITREELVRKTGLSDRKIRDEINTLRKNPRTVIVSSSHGKGYKRPSNVDELRNCLYESKSRVNDELEKQRVLYLAIGKMERENRLNDGQLTFDFGG